MNLHQRRIYEHLVDRVYDGRLGLGAKLPTEVELGEQFKTSRLNAHYAVKRLEEAGLVSRNKRGGSIVASKPSGFTLGQLKGVTAERVCVLNQCEADHAGIHWNERLLGPLESALRERELSLSYENINGLSNPADYRTLLAGLVADGCKALLLVADGTGKGVAFERPELLSEFHDNVYIFDPGQAVWADFPYNAVSLNLFGEGELAARHLLERHGLKRLVFLKTLRPFRLWAERRIKGIDCAMKRLLGDAGGLELHESATLSAEWLKSMAAAGDIGLIAANDEVGARVVDLARDSGQELGGEGLKLVSFDDNACYRDRGLTTVAPFHEQIGVRLAEMICSGLTNAAGPGEITCVKINSRLIERQTA